MTDKLSAFLADAEARCHMTSRASTGEPGATDDQWTRNVATVGDLKTAPSLLKAANDLIRDLGEGRLIRAWDAALDAERQKRAVKPSEEGKAP